MLPEELSTGRTSLAPGGDRLSLAVDMFVAEDGSLKSSLKSFDVYRALVRNKFQFAYEAIGPWLESGAPKDGIQVSADLQAQLQLQDEAAARLRNRRHVLGALHFDRVEVRPLVANGEVRGLTVRGKNHAADLIEDWDFMVAANEVMAQTLTREKVSSIRRIVRSPERWPRIVELAASRGGSLPGTPNSAALNAFLQTQTEKQKDPTHFPDL